MYKRQEQEHLRVGRQRTGDLQPPLVTVGQVAGELVACAPDACEVQQLLGPLAGIGFALAEPRATEDRGDRALLHPRVPADHDVLERGHVREQPDVLERPGDARDRHLRGVARQLLAVQQHLAL